MTSAYLTALSPVKGLEEVEFKISSIELEEVATALDNVPGWLTRVL